MNGWIGAVSGLLMGLALQRMGLADTEKLRGMLAGRERSALRSVLFALGFGTLGVAVLGWLAVLDVDQLAILPLHSGVWIGGAAAGVTIGLVGATPATACAAVGGERFLAGLCTAAGCALGAYAWTLLGGIAAPLQTLFPPAQETLFRVTLTTSFWWSGGFLGMGCLAAVWFAAALCVRPTRARETTSAPQEDVPWVLAETQEALVPNEDASAEKEDAEVEDEFMELEDRVEDPDMMEKVAESEAVQDARLAQLLGKTPLSSEAEPAMMPVPEVRVEEAEKEEKQRE